LSYVFLSIHQSGDVSDVFKSRLQDQWSLAHPTIEQGNKLFDILDQGLQAGALAVVSTLGCMR
jgi:hypothetical protein